MKRLTALILCFAMLTALCGCTGGAGSTTTVPPTTTEPAPTAADLYAEAAEKLAALETVALEITYTEEIVLGADTFTTTTEQDVLLQGLGTEAFAALTEEKFLSGASRTYTTETFFGGMVYTEMDDCCYKSEMTAEEYLDCIIPPAVLDASLYAAVEQTSETEFTFTDAAALESWCDTPYAILDSASATATLGEDGLPRKFTYNATFSSGAADKTICVTVKVTSGDEDPIAAPEKADDYLTVEYIAAPYLLRNARAYLDQATAIVSSSADVVTFEAGGFVETNAITMAAWGEGDDQIGSFTTDYQFLDRAYGENESYTMVETFTDGVLTVTVDDGEPEINSNVSRINFRNAVENELTYLYPEVSGIRSLELTVIGDTVLLEYTFDEESGPRLEDYYCDHYYGDPEILSKDATACNYVDNSGYMGIDLTTGMPLSMGDSFEMTHTLSGRKYTLSAVNQISLRLGAKDAYKTITGEELPAQEPEEKASPVFYKVTGENGEQMWLLGTIHVGDERTAFLPQEIYDAFSAADALAVEFDSESYAASLMEDQAAIQAYVAAMIYTDGTTLDDHIEDETVFEDTVNLLRATGNYADERTFLLTKPIFHYQTLSNYFLSNGYRLSSEYGVDLQLEALAREQGKEILSVESGEFQMDLLGNLSDPLQELMLKETIAYGQFAHNYETEQLFEMWCRGDEAELIAYLNEEEEDPEMTEEEKALYEEYETALGGQRNVDMLSVAEEYLTGGKTVFYAVGLAHLLAEDGLVNTLRDAGYTVERVTFAE